MIYIYNNICKTIPIVADFKDPQTPLNFYETISYSILFNPELKNQNKKNNVLWGLPLDRNR